MNLEQNFMDINFTVLDLGKSGEAGLNSKVNNIWCITIIMAQLWVEVIFELILR